MRMSATTAARSFSAVLALLAGWASAAPALATEVAGKPQIIDGDTLDIGDVRIRLHGIDAAETGQRCIGEGRKIVRPGDMAVDRLSALGVDGLACSGNELDAYGRLIAVCRSSAGEDVGRVLVREGLAWAFVNFSNDYLPEEQAARKAKLGAWKLACDTPWQFRAARWEASTQKAPEGCPIKGNISASGRIYHLPWDRFYAATKIDLAKGEHWFCEENQALKAGWRRALR